jgi:hypothetical protein
MATKRIRAGVVATAVALAVPAVVQAGSIPYGDPGANGFTVEMNAKFKHHHPTKLVYVAIKTLDCGGSYLWPDPIKVKNGKFKDSRFEHIEEGITYKIKGRFVKHNEKVKGTVSADQVGSDCNNTERFAIRRMT